MGLGLLGLLSVFQITNPLQQIPQAVIDSSPVYAAEVENLLIKNAPSYMMGDSIKKQTCWADDVVIGDRPVFVMTCKTIKPTGIDRKLNLSLADSNSLVVLYDIEIMGHALACSFVYQGQSPFHAFNNPECDFTYHQLIGPVRTFLKERYARRREP